MPFTGSRIFLVPKAPMATSSRTIRPEGSEKTLEARADIGHVRVRGPEGSRTVEKTRFLEGAS